MKILLLTDKQNWAYDSIAKALVKYNRSSADIDVLHIKTDKSKIKARYHQYHKILVMGWQNYPSVSFIPQHKCMAGIHSHHSWDEKETSPEKDVSPPKELISLLSKFQRVNAVSKRLYDLFQKSGLKNVSYTPNGVDTKMFRPASPLGSRELLYVGYSGSKAHDWRKGVTKFIKPACKAAKVQVKLAMLSTNKYVKLNRMPSFYNAIDCYVCASSSEGFSLSVLEAAACGRPIVTTAVGGMDELVIPGTGFIVPRHVKGIAKKLSYLDQNRDELRMMGKKIREHVVENFSWAKQVTAWMDFLRR